MFKYGAVHASLGQSGYGGACGARHIPRHDACQIKRGTENRLAYAWQGEVLCVKTRVIIRAQPYCRV